MSLLKPLATPIVWVFVLLIGSIWILRSTRKEGKQKYGWYLLIAGTCIFYLLSLQPVSSTLVYLLERNYPPPTKDVLSKVNIIVVLGGGVLPSWHLGKDAEPSGVTYSRVFNGVKLFRRSKARYIIVSGGRGRFGEETVAEVMKKLAIQLGIPPDMISLEPRSLTTWEHPEEVVKLIKKSPNKTVVGLVTSALHMKRSLIVFERHFPNVVPLPCNYASRPLMRGEVFIVPSVDALLLSTDACHEVIGIIWYKIKIGL